MDEELFFLIGINEDKNGNTVNLMTTQGKWKRLLTMARANGWKPRGTILDVEFQLNLELSMIEEPDAVNIDALRKQVEERCKRWQGVYQIPQYQIVSADDAMEIGKAMEGTDADADLLLFLSKGGFRIAG
jgi:hypothetical protein